MKKWEKPKLLVLVRSNPEESCIIYCKTTGGSDSPTMAQTFCYQTNCLNCNNIGTS